MNSLPPFTFFGSPQIAVWVLEELERVGFTPSLIVTNPDAPQGRKMVVTSTPVGVWAESHGIETIKPVSLRDDVVIEKLHASGCKLFIVAAYGKMIPDSVLEIPKYKTLNVHPSLLPKLRGASPIRSAILADMNPTGVSIMELTSGMDEGPLLAQKEISVPSKEWPIHGATLDELLAREGGALLASLLPDWIAGTITPVPQEGEPTYCAKITKEVGEIDLSHDPYQNLLKIRAFDGWPGTHFFIEKNGARIRVKIVDAELAKDGSLKILRIIPEGKKEMAYEDFLRG